jgi:hypothetical protein
MSYLVVPTLTSRFVSHRHVASRPDKRDLSNSKVCFSVHRRAAMEAVLSQISEFRIITPFFYFKYSLYYCPIYVYASQVFPCLPSGFQTTILHQGYFSSLTLYLSLSSKDN